MSHNRKTRIAVISKADSSGGGASVIAETHSRLLEADEQFDCHHWLGYTNGNWHARYRKLHGGAVTRFFWKAVNWFSIRAGFPDFFTPELPIFLAQKKPDYDLYHVHDMARSVSPMTFRWLCRQGPVVHTLHDCSTFTGGCLYPMDCESFSSRCGNCPQLNVWPLKPPFDHTGWMQDYKRRTAANEMFVAVTPSNWMADQAMKSGMFKRRPKVIPNGVDTETFSPSQRANIRQELRIPKDTLAVFLNAYWLSDPRKGIADAIKALHHLPKKPFVIAVGKVTESEIHRFDGLKTHFTGFLTSRSDVAAFTSAADVLLYPTYADNLPNSVLEAMACGTPTIGYEVGGMSDMVDHGKNGWLAPVGSIQGLVDGLKVATDEPARLHSWSGDCRATAESKFSNHRFLEAHKALYEQILSNPIATLPHLAG